MTSRQPSHERHPVTPDEFAGGEHRIQEPTDAAGTMSGLEDRVDLARLDATNGPLVALVHDTGDGAFTFSIRDERRGAILDTGQFVDHNLAHAARRVANMMRERIRQYPACDGAADLCGSPAGIACDPGCPSLAADDHDDDPQLVRTITRDEYERDRRSQYAGPVSTLYPAPVGVWHVNQPDWDGQHWAMWNEPGVGTVFGPINVRD